ncbi:hypothetical protein MP228_001881 [Amoeboaphelidium protococcarum]|nr:hypothetical protein MP228_001881 [Amoeboaphelidium protococcarum]
MTNTARVPVVEDQHNLDNQEVDEEEFETPEGTVDVSLTSFDQEILLELQDTLDTVSVGQSLSQRLQEFQSEMYITQLKERLDSYVDRMLKCQQLLDNTMQQMNVRNETYLRDIAAQEKLKRKLLITIKDQSQKVVHLESKLSLSNQRVQQLESEVSALKAKYRHSVETQSTEVSLLKQHNAKMIEKMVYAQAIKQKWLQAELDKEALQKELKSLKREVSSTRSGQQNMEDGSRFKQSKSNVTILNDQQFIDTLESALDCLNIQRGHSKDEESVGMQIVALYEHTMLLQEQNELLKEDLQHQKDQYTQLLQSSQERIQSQEGAGKLVKSLDQKLVLIKQKYEEMIQQLLSKLKDQQTAINDKNVIIQQLSQKFKIPEILIKQSSGNLVETTDNIHVQAQQQQQQQHDGGGSKADMDSQVQSPSNLKERKTSSLLQVTDKSMLRLDIIDAKNGGLKSPSMTLLSPKSSKSQLLAIRKSSSDLAPRKLSFEHAKSTSDLVDSGAHGSDNYSRPVSPPLYKSQSSILLD